MQFFGKKTNIYLVTSIHIIVTFSVYRSQISNYSNDTEKRLRIVVVNIDDGATREMYVCFSFVLFIPLAVVQRMREKKQKLCDESFHRFRSWKTLENWKEENAFCVHTYSKSSVSMTYQLKFWWAMLTHFIIAFSIRCSLHRRRSESINK